MKKPEKSGRPLKVAIVGTSPSSCAKAPYQNDSWEIWSLGGNAMTIPRFTRWFEMHTQRVLRNALAWEPIFKFLGECGDKLTLGHPCDELPFAKLYPVDEIKAKFGSYFTSTIAYMIALAIHEGADEIGLWGIDMLADEEYTGQRPCCEYLLGIARGMGINVVVAEESPILRCERMYAYEHTELSAEMAQMMRENQNSLESAEKNMMEANHLFSYQKGYKDALKNLHRRFG